jgi:hypothetical protein
MIRGLKLAAKFGATANLALIFLIFTLWAANLVEIRPASEKFLKLLRLIAYLFKRA